MEQGGEEEACKGGRSDLALVRWEEREEVQLRRTGPGGGGGRHLVGPEYAGRGHLRLPGKAGGGRKDGGSDGRTSTVGTSSRARTR